LSEWGIFNSEGEHLLFEPIGGLFPKFTNVIEGGGYRPNYTSSYSELANTVGGGANTVGCAHFDDLPNTLGGGANTVGGCVQKFNLCHTVLLQY